MRYARRRESSTGRPFERRPRVAAQTHGDLRRIRVGQDRADPAAGRGVRAAAASRRSCSTPTTTWPGSATPGPSRRTRGDRATPSGRATTSTNTDVVVWTPRRTTRAAAQLPAAAGLRGGAGRRRTSSAWPSDAAVGGAGAAGRSGRHDREGATGARRCSGRRCGYFARTAATGTCARFIDLLARPAGRGQHRWPRRDKLAPRHGRDADGRDGQRPAVRRRRRRRSTPACCSPRRRASGPGSRSSASSGCRPTSSGRASSTSFRWRCSPGSNATRPATGRSAGCS